MERRIFNGRGTRSQPQGGRGVNYRNAPMRRSNYVTGGHNGRNGHNRNNRRNGRRENQVITSEKLERDLENYFNKV